VFSKAARRNVTVPADLPDRLAALMNSRCLDLIGLARRSGAAVAGFEKVRAALDAGDVALLIEASDGADDGREKLARRAVGVETLSLWTADQLGAPFGRDRAVHAAIFAGGLADRLSREAQRCAGIQSEGADIGAHLELQESWPKMTDQKETTDGKKKKLSLSRPGKLELNKTVDAGQVRQSFLTVAQRPSL